MGLTADPKGLAVSAVALFILGFVAWWMISNTWSKAQAYGAQFGDACWEESGDYFNAVYVAHDRVPREAIRVEGNDGRCHIWTPGNWIPGERVNLVEGRDIVVGTANAAMIAGQPVLADAHFRDDLTFVDRPRIVEFAGSVLTVLYAAGYVLSAVAVFANGATVVLRDGDYEIGNLILKAVAPSAVSLFLLAVPPLFVDAPGGPILHLSVGVYVVFLVFPVLAPTLTVLATVFVCWPRSFRL